MTIARSVGPVASPVAKAVTGASSGGATLRLLGTRGSLTGQVRTGGRKHMASLKVVACHDATKLRVVVIGAIGSSSLPSDITVTAAIWKDGVAYQCLFSGNPSIALAENAYAISDEVSGLSVSAGDEVYLRTFASVASGTSMWQCQYLNGDNGDGFEIDGTDKTVSGTVSLAGTGASAEVGYTASALLGECSGHGVAVFGDSISVGTGDLLNIGYIGIACQRNGIPYVRFGQGGSTSSGGVNAIQNNTAVRAIVPYCSAAVWQYGVNDLSSGAVSSGMRSASASFAAAAVSLKPGIKLAICTIMPVTASDNSGPANDGYWNSTKETNRVDYNNSLRAGMPAGFDYLWEAAGDASGVSGLFRGAESAKDSGIFRADLGTQNGFSAVNDGLHPGRPLITAAAAAMNFTSWLGTQTQWGPEIAYATIPSSGLYAECGLIPSHYPVVETPGSVTGITIGGSNVVLMSKVDDATIRLYCYDRIGTGSKSVVVGSSNIAGTASNNTALAVSVDATNNSTWGGSSDPGTLIASDNFTRADTAYDATANNTTAGANWTDKNGNAAKIASNALKLQGQDSRMVYWNAANYTDLAAEIEFDPADFTGSSSDPFAFRLGVRINPADGSGVYAIVNRKADLASVTRLSVQNASSGAIFGDLNAANVTISNGTRYKLRLECAGSGSSKAIVARLINATTSETIASVTDSTYESSYPDAAGRVGFVTVHTAANDAATATASEVVVDNFAIRELSDNTSPVFASATLSSSGRYIDVGVTELGLPLLPTSAASGFSLSTGTVSETVIFGSDYVRVVLASTGSLPITLSYSQGTGNITDQTGNELTAFSQSVS